MASYAAMILKNLDLIGKSGELKDLRNWYYLSNPQSLELKRDFSYSRSTTIAIP
jgi:hypothetical protein